jgi:hypothetical protein
MNSTECELIALNDALFTILRIKKTLLFLGINIPPIRIFQDNKSAMQIALKGGGDVRKSKYMRVRINNVTNEINSGLIYLEYIPTKSMIADVLTKPLYSTLFTTLSHQLLNVSSSPNPNPIPKPTNPSSDLNKSINSVYSNIPKVNFNGSEFFTFPGRSLLT